MERNIAKEAFLVAITANSQEDGCQECLHLLQAYAQEYEPDSREVFALCSDIYDALYYDVIIKHRPIYLPLRNLLETMSLPTHHKTKQELYRIFQNEVESVLQRNTKKPLSTYKKKNPRK